MHRAPVGIFDSDIGGLSVVAEFRERLPFEDIYYYADTLHYPYGTKTKEQVYSYFCEVCDHLLEKGVKSLFCACSTASAVAIPQYRNPKVKLIQGLFNHELVVEVVGQALTRDIGLIATELTVKSNAFQKLFSEVPNNFRIHAVPASPLVDAVTKGDFSPETLIPIIKKTVSNLSGIRLGAIIIGCTHFYHIKNELRLVLGRIPVIEPSKVAVSCITREMRECGLLNPDPAKKGKVTCIVSGNLEQFRQRVKNLEKARGTVFIDEYIES